MMIALRAAIWKELREALGWGVLGLLVHSIVLSFIVSYTPDAAELLERIYASTALFSMLAGVIGVAQTLPEEQLDRWALLTHRPVSRSALLLAKAIAGLTLYAYALLLPVGIAFAWIAVPGHVAMPLDWRMVLPPVVDLVLGVAYYSAGVLIGVRQASWFGSRAIVVVVPLFCSLFTQSIPEFRQAVLVVMIANGVMGAAAWGSFAFRERFEDQPLIARAALGTVIGTAFLVTATISMVMMFFFLVTREHLRNPTYREYRITADGGISNTLNHVDQGSLEVASAQLQANPVDRGYRDPSRFFVNLNERFPSPANPLAFYVQNSGLIEIYDSQWKRRVGWLGPEGFSGAKAPPARRFDGVPRFERRWWQSDVRPTFPFSRAVYRLNLHARTVELTFTPEPNEEVVGASASWSSFQVVVTTRRVLVLGKDGKIEIAQPRDPRASGYGEVRVSRAFAAGAPTFIWYYPSHADRLLPPPLMFVTKYDDTETRYELPLPVSRRKTHGPEHCSPGLRCR